MRIALVIACIVGSSAYADETKWPNEDAARLGEQAKSVHKEAHETQNVAKYEQAHKLYQEYFAKYPDLPDADLTFYDAELLFRLQRYAEAAKQYERVTQLAPHGKLVREAAYGFVISTKNLAPPQSPPDAGPPCPNLQACPIPPADRELLHAFDVYLKLVPSSPEVPSISYRNAKLYYDWQHFAEAAPLFDQIFTKFPESELATYSANFEMHCLAVLKRYDALRALVERVKKSPAMKDAVTQEQVAEMDAGLKKRGK
jgi:tetratricopeptide (TPR) repeat protein